MLVALALTLLAESSNNITQSAETFVDALRLLESVFVVASTALLQAFAASKIDQIQATFARLAGRGIRSDDTKGEHRV